MGSAAAGIASSEAAIVGRTLSVLLQFLLGGTLIGCDSEDAPPLEAAEQGLEKLSLEGVWAYEVSLAPTSEVLEAGRVRFEVRQDLLVAFALPDEPVFAWPVTAHGPERDFCTEEDLMELESTATGTLRDCPVWYLFPRVVVDFRESVVVRAFDGWTLLESTVHPSPEAQAVLEDIQIEGIQAVHPERGTSTAHLRLWKVSSS